MMRFLAKFCGSDGSEVRKDLDELRGKTEEEAKNAGFMSEEEKDWLDRYQDSYSTDNIMGYRANPASPVLPRKSAITKEDSQIIQGSYEKSCEILHIPEFGLGSSARDSEVYSYSYSSDGEEYLGKSLASFDNFPSSILRTKSESEKDFFGDSDRGQGTASESDIRQSYEEYVTPRNPTKICLEELNIRQTSYESKDYIAGNHKSYDKNTSAESE